MTLCIGRLHPITVYRTGFWVWVILILIVIRCSFCYFLDRNLFNHDFHHDNCDCDFYGHSVLLNYNFRLSVIISSDSANAQHPRCFCPWQFSLNIGFTMLPSDSFMSCVYSLLGYSTGKFQALLLKVLTAFGATD